VTQAGRIVLAKMLNIGNLKKSDIIIIGKYKYLIYKITKKMVDLLPIDELFEEEGSVELIPKLSVATESIDNYTKLDSYEILCLLNQTNPLIVESLEYFLEN